MRECRLCFIQFQSPVDNWLLIGFKEIFSVKRKLKQSNDQKTTKGNLPISVECLVGLVFNGEYAVLHSQLEGGNNMKLAGSQLIKLYMHTPVLIGNIHYTSTREARLSDVLNGVSDTGPVRRGKFLELTDVTIRNRDGEEEKLKFSYINKSTVQLAVTLGGSDSGRSTGENKGSRSYPFVEKSPMPVRIETHDYIVNGNMYCMNYQSIWQVLEDTPAFLPLTQVQVYTLANGAPEVFPFAAVNKEHILSLQDGNVKQKTDEEPTIAEVLRNRDETVKIRVSQ